MKIVSLTAENVKRLKAVHIEPDGTLQVISGRNAQGKSSVLDAIWLALGGGAAQRETAKPIRDGEETASVTLDLGDIKVERTWKGGKTALTVTSAEGAKFSSPQSMLDALVGRLSFDPLAFTRLDAKSQLAALLDLVDLDVDLDEIAAERQRLYDERTEIGRQGKALGDVPEVDESLPTEERSATELLSKIRQAQEDNAARTEAERGVRIAVDKVAELEAELANWQTTLKGRKAALDALPPVTDTATLESDLANVEANNAAIRANNAARERATVKKSLTADYNARTAEIDALDKSKADALAKAEFPIEGLGFTEDGVTYQGVPFAQASSAEQIQVSLAMAMALNPKLRVLRIMDGSLLDSDAMNVIADMAAKHDYQVWVERVADGSGMGVVIEDGEVA